MNSIRVKQQGDRFRQGFKERIVEPASFLLSSDSVSTVLVTVSTFC